VSVELLRHVNGVIADFAAEYGQIDLVGRRIECPVDTYETLLETFETFGIVGGAGIRVTDDGAVLLVKYEGAGGWVDPGDSRRPAESYTACAKRGLREAAGIEATVDGIAQIHLLYLDDPTGRDPIPNPYISFQGRKESGTVRAGDGVVAARWMERPPEELLYEELAEHPLSVG
jgi:ADP-ribose pyrophosphatase YjhB (NUDIX family)